MRPLSVSRAFAVAAVVVAVMSLALAGCSLRQKNQVLNEGPDGITIRYDSRFPTMAGVDADEHCAKFGKMAKRVETTKPSSPDTITHPHAAQGVFECVSAE